MEWTPASFLPSGKQDNLRICSGKLRTLRISFHALAGYPVRFAVEVVDGMPIPWCRGDGGSECPNDSAHREIR